MFNQMLLIDNNLFIVCTTFKKKRSIKSLDKLTCSVYFFQGLDQNKNLNCGAKTIFLCDTVCRCQSLSATGCKTLCQFYLLGKVHIPKVHGS